jgi:hypothetical protein
VLEPFEPAAVPVHVIHGEGRGPRPKVAAFVQLAASRLRDSLGARAWPAIRSGQPGSGTR